MLNLSLNLPIVTNVACAATPTLRNLSIATNNDNKGIACCNRFMALPKLLVWVVAVFAAVPTPFNDALACLARSFTFSNPFAVCTKASPVLSNRNLSCLASPLTFLILVDAVFDLLETLFNSLAVLLRTGVALPPNKLNCCNSLPTKPISSLAGLPNKAN